METLRKPFQGVWNIVRFNWHFYVLSVGLVLLLWFSPFLVPALHPTYFLLPAFTVLFVTLISLVASTYIYDLSGLYSLEWMDELSLGTPKAIANVNAGFDETSKLLAQKFPEADLAVLDFYDPEKHTEVSIKRARKAYAPYPNTVQFSTDKVPLKDGSVVLVFVILSAHEIRDTSERTLFFKELRRVLEPNGKIVVTEHLRDMPNFLAYSIGFFHFHSRKTWQKTFAESGLKVTEEIKITPFLTTFVLEDASTL